MSQQIIMSRAPSYQQARMAEKVKRSVLRLVGIIGLYYQRHHQRQLLLKLDERLLKDIGIRRLDAWQEGKKPFWRD